ncbi:MAG: hypothetical protein AAFO81_03535 [Pseudomonadota bacterium]
MSDTPEDNHEHKVARQLAEHLDANVEPDVMARLRAAREEAVVAAGGRTSGQPWRWVVPMGGAVAAAALVLSLNNPSVMQLPALDEQELAAAAELELLESLEMLAWLDEQVLADAG